MEAFYEPLGRTSDGAERFRSTGSTSGPWDPAAQHAGPPSALLARTAVAAAAQPGLVPARVTVDVLGPVPVDEVQVRGRVARGGRSVELVEAELSAGGRVAARCAVWRVAPATGEAVASRDPAAPPRPDDPEPSGAGTGARSETERETAPVRAAWTRGYLAAVEWRWVRGGFEELGPATVWTRLRVPLVAGEDTSPLTRVLAVADSGNGVSGELDLDRWLFINPELTVHLHRAAVGEWVCLDAATAISPGGVGLATSVLSDDDGPVARGAQSLLVRER